MTTAQRKATLADVLRRLEARTHYRPRRQADGNFQARCPAHNDTRPSLSVGKGRLGIVMRCFSNCSFNEICAALDYEPRQLFDDFEPSGTRRQQPTYSDALAELVAHRPAWTRAGALALGAEVRGNAVAWPMFDGDGEVCGWKLRRGDNRPFELRSGQVKSLTEKGSRSGILYPRPFPDSDPVLVVEGEADAVAALSAGHQAVVATAGAQVTHMARRALQKLLAGRRVVLAPDPDAAGRRWKRELTRVLLNADCAVAYIASDDRDLEERLTDA